MSEAQEAKMKPVTYLYIKDRKYHIGTAPDLIHALRICKEQGALETIILNAEVENTIRTTGIKKIYNLINISNKYNLTYENTTK